MSAADDLRALTDAATPSPWEIDELAEGENRPAVCTIDGAVDIFPVQRLAFTEMGDDRADAELIVWLRNHADALADLMDAAKAVEDDHPYPNDSAPAVLRDALEVLDADA